MKKNKKTIIIVVVILLILVFAYFARRRSQPSNQSATGSSSTGISLPISGYTQSTCTENTALKKGMECDTIKSAQNLINTYSFLYALDTLTIDGKFGPKTQAAFQKVLGKPSGTLKELKATI